MSRIDEGLYFMTAQYYLEGIGEGDMSRFLALSEHPPLAILMVGVFKLLLTPFGLDKARIVERVFSSVCLGVVSIVSYLMAEKRRGVNAGLLAWFLTAGQLIVIPYESWGKGLAGRAEVNGFSLTFTGGGAAPYFQFAPMVLSTMVFISLTLHFLLDYEDQGSLVKAGICYGLASLMNSVAPPILFAICFIWLTYKIGIRSAAVKTGRVLMIGLMFMVLGNPVFWNLDRLTLSVKRFVSTNGVAHVANHPFVLLKSLFWGGTFYSEVRGGDEPLTVSYLILTGTLLYWVKVYLEMWLVQLFLILSVYTALRGSPLRDERTLFLAWFSVFFLFLSMMMKPVVFIEPHLDYFIPPLALYCTFTLCEHPRLQRFFSTR